jgi:signal transduction histidine kinase
VKAAVTTGVASGRGGRFDLRPLDPVRSVKAKLGLLVVASTSATALFSWYGLERLGWYPRSTLPVAVLLSLAVTQVLAHGMTRPLRQMTAAAREMATGRYDHEVLATSRDEVGELAQAFTAMAGELAAADQRRRELLADLGHELRTPVAAARARLENFVDGVEPADARGLEGALEQVERLGHVVDDLLDLARADANADELARTAVPLTGLLDGVAAEAGTVHPGRHWSVTVTPPALAVWADPARLRQAVVNLADNAARHAGAGGAITLRAQPDARGGTVVEVIDDGPGIPASDRDRVFERFTRGRPRGVDDGYGGTGLGLAIVRRVVEQHGGTVAVADAATGCRIRLVLPEEPR